MPSRTPTSPHAPSAPSDRPPRSVPKRWGRNPTPAEDRAHLVRVIASQPAHMAWLREHNAKVLTDAAAGMVEAGHLSPAQATLLTERAAEHRAGTVTPW